MTNIVFITATPAEFMALRSIKDKGFPCFISGIGSTACAICTMQAIKRYDPQMIVQVGIAGATDRTLKIGQVVCVGSDFEADLGAWRSDESKFVSFDAKTYRSDFVAEGIAVVSACTVTTACTPLVEHRSQIETMEGAAFFAAADACSVRSAQIRSISNYTTDPRENWKVDEAIEVLGTVISKIF